MELTELDALRKNHAAWRLLRADNATLMLAVLGEFFVEGNRGAVAGSEVAVVLDEYLYAYNAETDPPRFPKSARAYLEDWSSPQRGFLRRFYPDNSEEIHYEVTPAFEKAYTWVISLRTRRFVATESRLHTAVNLLREIVQGTNPDPVRRLEELERRRREIDQEIERVSAGNVAQLAPAGVRDRYQQFATTARDLLSDFREVEENFRNLDRQAREQIATWDGSKGELLRELVATRTQISESDQGHSFNAFYDFILSSSRQEELAELLDAVGQLPEIEVDNRVRTVHHDWSEAADRTQHTVRKISEQLRRFLDEQVWLENRRVLELIREIERAAVQTRTEPADFGLEIDEPGIAIALPFERPLYQTPASIAVHSLIAPAEREVDADALFTQDYVDQAKLAANIRTVLSPHSTMGLAEVLQLFPLERGAAELVGYLALAEEDLELEFDRATQDFITYPDPQDPQRTKQITIPKVRIKRQ